jgi:hypothetical protein
LRGGARAGLLMLVPRSGSGRRLARVRVASLSAVQPAHGRGDGEPVEQDRHEGGEAHDCPKPLRTHPPCG